MPSKYHIFKSNRSQASLLSAQGARSHQPSPIESPLNSPAFPPPSAATSLGALQQDDDDDLGPRYEPEAASFYSYQQTIPRRAQSQRTPPSHFDQPSINLVEPSRGGADSTIDEDPDAYYQQILAKPEQKKKSRFFGLGHSNSAKDQSNNLTANPPKTLGRSISVRRKAPEPLTNTGHYSPQQRWPSGSVSATLPSSTTEEAEVGLGISTPHSDLPPTIPPKDPGRSPYIQPSSQEDFSHNKYPTPTAPSGRSSSEQLINRTAAWEKATRITNHYRHPTSDQPPHYQAFLPAASSDNPTSFHPLPTQTPAYQHQQTLQDSRPSSQQSYEAPSPSQSQSRAGELQYQQRIHPQNSTFTAYDEASMGPPTQSHPSSRTTESSTTSTQPGSREGYSYSQGGQGRNQSAEHARDQYSSQLGVNNPQAGNYRGQPQPSPMAPQNSNEGGRHTPPPSRSRDDLASLDVAQLLARHDELQEKYRKVKKYYFDKDAQVQQLQNTLAHQRLSQSRTSLDDNEYQSRFNRLDGAINNLAFNIRKDWRAVPPWLASQVNKDATTIVTKEMTAVGRACISRWLVDEILDRYFHPGLEPGLSSQLKIIEKNLRRFASPTPTDEEKDALVAKISNWRLSTLDGLQEMMISQQAMEYRDTLTDSLVEKLTASLMMSLKEPPSPGLDAGVIGIVELAVGIAANIPLESREVFVDYVLPGTLVNESYMKVEGSLPPLTNPGEGLNDAAEKASIASADIGAGDKDETDRESVKDVSLQGQQPQQQQQSQQQGSQNQGQQKKKGMFGGLMGKKPASSTPSSSTAAAQADAQRGAGSQGQGQGQIQGQQQQQQQQQGPKEERVRFAAFMAVEVRGKSVLVKAPVYV